MFNSIGRMRQACKRGLGRRGGFLRDRSGAMAVEFAMVAAPLLFMIFAILELGLVYMVSSSLENATNDAARRIRTGDTQSAGGVTGADFRNAVCDRLGWLQAQCKTNGSQGLKVDVRAYSDFRNQNAPNPLQNGAFDETNVLFNTGGPDDIVLVRTWLPWTLLTPFLQGSLDPDKDGVKHLTAAATFKNEPYGN